MLIKMLIKDNLISLSINQSKRQRYTLHTAADKLNPGRLKSMSADEENAVESIDMESG